MSFIDNVVAYFKLDEASGVPIDAHGSAVMSEVGTVGSTTGRLNTSRLFDGNANYFSSTDSIFNTGDISFGFSVWCYPTSAAGNYRVFCKINGALTQLDYQLFWRNDGSGSRVFVWQVYNGTTSIGFVTSPQQSLNKWHHIICWHDVALNQICMIVNDGAAITASTTGAAGSSAAPFSIGSLDTLAGSRFIGMIDELAFFKNYVPTLPDRRSLYNLGYGNPYPLTHIAITRKYKSTPVYVDCDLASNTGDGTIGNPYGDLQYALSNYTWNSVDGTLIWAHGTENVTAQLTDPNMFLSDAAPVYLHGWDGATQEGPGWLTLNGGNGAYAPLQYTNRMGLRRIKIHNFNGSLAFGGSSFRSPNHYVDLEITDCVSVNLGGGVLRRCWIHHMRTGTQAIIVNTANGTILDCLISDCTLSTYGAYLSSGGTLQGTILHESGRTFPVLTLTYDASIVTDISIHSPTLGFNHAMSATSGNYPARGGNILIEGSGSGHALRDGSVNSELTLEDVSAYNVVSIFGTSVGDIAPEVEETHELLGESPFAKVGTLPTDFTASDFWPRVYAYFRPKNVGDVIVEGRRVRGAVQPVASAGEESGNVLEGVIRGIEMGRRGA